jgi:hypothetical protein
MWYRDEVQRERKREGEVRNIIKAYKGRKF